MTLELEGYQTWSTTQRDPFEDHCGPFFLRKLPDGTVETAFEAKAHHCNAFGILHGGVLMSFADFSLFAIANDKLGAGSAVTVSFSSDFISGAGADQVIKGRGQVTRAGARLIFIRGEIFCDTGVLLSFSGVIMRR
jgi:uncharacterized protein (TIGR00369 family)